jgi:Flp pilus assembly protein TadB
MGDRRRDASAEAPEVVSYLAMGLTAAPALDRAMAFAADHATGPLACDMRGALWDVHMRRRSRIEDAFLSVADAWGSRDGDVKRALYGIAHAVRDGSPGTLARALDRARTQVFEGARRKMRDYAASLRGPTTALFALGVLLPLIVSSMVPLLSVGSFSPSALEAPVRAPGNPLPWILLLDVGFPAATFAFAHAVSAGRPRSSLASRVRLRRPLVGFLAAPLAVLFAIFFAHPMAPVLALGIVVASVSVGLVHATRGAVRERRRREALEREFPDALFQLGGRLEEGQGLEAALLAVADATQGTECADLFRGIVHAMRFGGGTVEDAIFGHGGALERTPSRTVRASLKIVVDLAAKDPATAGRAALETSSHLRDLQGIEQDLRAELRPTVDAMRATATFFAPAVLGVSASLYGLLFRAFGSMASLPMAPATYATALGVYLALTAAAILWFASRIAGDGGDGFGHALGRSLPVAYAVYLIAVIASAGIV